MADEEEQVTEEPRSLADDLSAAFDTHEEPEGDDDGVSASSEDSTATDLPADNSEPATGDASDQGLPDGSGADGAGVLDSEDAPEGEGQADKAAGAPVSWNATARETWKDIPEAAQAYIQQREKEFEQGIQQHAQGAQRAQQMDKVLEPYGQFFAMNGGAGETIKGLLQTGANLQMGSPVQKANMIATLINQFGVDISALDNVLVGKQPDPGTAQQDAIQQGIASAMQPYQQFMQGQQQQAQQQKDYQQQQVGSEVEQFASDPKNEFYRDVSGDMADILDMAANRGVQMSLPDAYSRACQLNPEVSKIVSNRTAATNAGAKRRATGSIQGGPGGSGNYEAPSDVRGAIELAFEQAGQGVR